MNKIVNCQAIQPTKKPNLTHKSHLIDPITQHHRSNSMNNQGKKLSLQDCMRQTPSQLPYSTRFKQNLLYTKDHDLASSFSFSEQETDYQYQKLLFAKFLQAKEAEWMSFMHDMNKISQQNLVSFVKIGETEKAVRNNRIIAHYLGVWLDSMGYKDLQARKRLVTIVRFLYPDEQESVAKIAGILYDTLFQGYLPQYLQLRVLVEVCKRGWQYLGMFIARFIKILKKYRNLKEQNFIEQVQSAIV